VAALLPYEVRQAITARILALTPTNGYGAGASGYAQTANDAWREAADPLFPEWEPQTRQHLSFFVDDRDLEDTIGARGHDDHPVMGAPLVVRFLASWRPMSRKVDWDAAGKAGAHLYRHLLADGWTQDFEVQRTTRPITRIPAEDGVIVVEVRVRALYQFSLADQ
jgi:hypothetical protein